MNNSLNIRLVIPYMKVSRHVPYQCRFLSTKTRSLSVGLARRPSLGLSEGFLRPKGLSILDIGLHRHNHFLGLGSYANGGHFRLGVCIGPSFQRRVSIVKTSQLSYSKNLSECEGLPEDHANVIVEPKLADSIDPMAQLDIEGITDGDPTLERKLKILFLELDVWRQEGRRVPSPSLLKNEQWKELLNTNTRSARQKYLSFLWGIELKKLSKKRKKEESQDESMIYPEDDGHLRYGLNHNTIFMRVYDTTINQHYNNKLIQAIQFGQKIVVDCGYDAHMTTREAVNAAKQIMLLFSENRFHNDPFNLYICNANRKSKTLVQLHSFINTMYDDHFPLNVTNKSYLELFPKEDIVYLTPHCREEMTSFDHDTVYVIGGIVDKVNHEPLSLAKAKREGLRMAKLPLERYLHWGSGSGKSLTINQMILIMLEMKTSGDWAKALQHVPRRKLYHDDHESGESQFKAKQVKQYRSKRENMFGHRY